MRQGQSIERIAAAWRQAGSDLMIEVVAPFALSAAGGTVLGFAAWVKDFGAARGTLLLPIAHGEAPERPAATRGYFLSYLAECYERYDRPLFINTLNDWGWKGPASEAPGSYTGKPWTGEQPNQG
jgi:hypothetical protein